MDDTETQVLKIQLQKNLALVSKLLTDSPGWSLDVSKERSPGLTLGWASSFHINTFTATYNAMSLATSPKKSGLTDVDNLR